MSARRSAGPELSGRPDLGKQTQLLLATSNPGKIAEYRELLQEVPFRLVSVDELENAPNPPPEDAPTYEGNAIAKALAYARDTHMLSAADDSGLELDALGGEPGPRTRRYFGEGLSDAERNRRLLELLENRLDRSARFVCVVALAWPHGKVETYEGACSGRIAPEPRGNFGFGYDPVFIPEGEKRTMAELPPSAKHRISHRGRAAANLAARLREHVRA
jgi:XTP/dITP diphosphohydrolase